jgi:hypothetical protein
MIKAPMLRVTLRPILVSMVDLRPNRPERQAFHARNVN